MSSKRFALATIGSRIGAMVIDMIVTTLLLFVALVMLQSAAVEREQLLVAFISVVVVAVVWYGWQVGDGRTAGQRLCGIRIVDKSTQAPIGTARALGRIVVRPVSLLFTGLGFLWAIWDADRQTWHDKIVDSIVVNTRSSSPAQAATSSFPPPSTSSSAATARLRQLDDLLATGLITPAEHAEKRAQVLETL